VGSNPTGNFTLRRYKMSDMEKSIKFKIGDIVVIDEKNTIKENGENIPLHLK
jgi:hypothetical protein